MSIKLVCHTKTARNPAFYSSLYSFKIYLEILHGSCWMKFCPVFLSLRIRKKALERREETIIVDRACRQETLAYEMVSSLSACRISTHFSTAEVQILVAFFLSSLWISVCSKCLQIWVCRWWLRLKEFCRKIGQELCSYSLLVLNVVRGNSSSLPLHDCFYLVAAKALYRASSILSVMWTYRTAMQNG